MKTFKQFLKESKQPLNEAFLSDEQEILDWLKENDFEYDENNYTIKNGIVDIKGGVSFYGLKLSSLPVQFGIVNGYFDCSKNQLTSLKGCPKKVGKNFDCSHNKLKSLKGAPEKVGGDFNCSTNKLTTLEGSPKEVGGWFICSENQLTSLEGAPKEVGKNFDCIDNPLLRTLDDIGAVKGKILSDVDE